MTRVQFHQWSCVLSWAKYGNGRTALRLINPSTEELIATATVNVPEATLAPDEVLIKDYSENEGMLDALERAGVVAHTGLVIENGYVVIPVARLLVSPE